MSVLGKTWTLVTASACADTREGRCPKREGPIIFAGRMLPARDSPVSPNRHPRDCSQQLRGCTWEGTGLGEQGPGLVVESGASGRLVVALTARPSLCPPQIYSPDHSSNNFSPSPSTPVGSPQGLPGVYGMDRGTMSDLRTVTSL